MSYFKNHITSELKISLFGFFVTMMGVACAFVSIELNLRWLGGLALLAVIFGIFVGFVGILLGWLGWGGPAIRGSYKASKDLRVSFLKYFSKKDK